jgi:hypothetical protein
MECLEPTAKQDRLLLLLPRSSIRCLMMVLQLPPAHQPLKLLLHMLLQMLYLNRKLVLPSAAAVTTRRPPLLMPHLAAPPGHPSAAAPHHLDAPAPTDLTLQLQLLLLRLRHLPLRLPHQLRPLLLLPVCLLAAAAAGHS